MNFTTINDTQTDNLGHGIYEYLTGSINKVYKENGKKVEFSSAENIIYALFDRKSDKSIARLKKSAEVALKILEEAFKQLKEGLTELEIVNLVHSIFENTKKDIINNEIIDLDYSWRKEFCPIVLVGPSLLKGGHALASNQKLQRGHTIYFDFGVTFYWRESA